MARKITKRISVYLEPDDLVLLNSFAEVLGVSQTKAIIHAIKESVKFMGVTYEKSPGGGHDAPGAKHAVPALNLTSEMLEEMSRMRSRLDQLDEVSERLRSIEAVQLELVKIPSFIEFRARTLAEGIVDQSMASDEMILLQAQLYVKMMRRIPDVYDRQTFGRIPGFDTDEFKASFAAKIKAFAIKEGVKC